MTLDESLDAHLTADAGVSAIAGTRIYFAFPPKGATRPLVTYALKSMPRQALQGDEYVDTPVYDVGAWVDPGSSPDALQEAITAALHGFTGLLGGGSGVEVGHIIRTDKRSEVLDLGDFTFLVGSIGTYEMNLAGG